MYIYILYNTSYQVILHPTPVPTVAASFAAAPQPGSVAAAAAAPAGHLP